MPFIKRHPDGHIHSIAQQQETGYTEYLPINAPEVIEFLGEDLGERNNKGSQQALRDSDRDIPRITEDLIYLLINKNVILFTELPEAVQHKLLSREKLRSTARSIMENFLDEDDML